MFGKHLLPSFYNHKFSANTSPFVFTKAVFRAIIKFRNGDFHKAAFDQAEKEVTDLHSRISQGIREAKKNGTQIGISWL